MEAAALAHTWHIGDALLEVAVGVSRSAQAQAQHRDLGEGESVRRCPGAYLPGWEDLLDVIQVDPIPIFQLSFSTPGAEKTKMVKGWHLPGKQEELGRSGNTWSCPPSRPAEPACPARRKCPGAPGDAVPRPHWLHRPSWWTKDSCRWDADTINSLLITPPNLPPLCKSLAS